MYKDLIPEINVKTEMKPSLAEMGQIADNFLLYVASATMRVIC